MGRKPLPAPAGGAVGGLAGPGGCQVAPLTLGAEPMGLVSLLVPFYGAVPS